MTTTCPSGAPGELREPGQDHLVADLVLGAADHHDRPGAERGHRGESRPPWSGHRTGSVAPPRRRTAAARAGATSAPGTSASCSPASTVPVDPLGHVDVEATARDGPCHHRVRRRSMSSARRAARRRSTSRTRASGLNRRAARSLRASASTARSVNSSIRSMLRAAERHRPQAIGMMAFRPGLQAWNGSSGRWARFSAWRNESRAVPFPQNRRSHAQAHARPDDGQSAPTATAGSRIRQPCDQGQDRPRSRPRPLLPTTSTTVLLHDMPPDRVRAVPSCSRRPVLPLRSSLDPSSRRERATTDGRGDVRRGWAKARSSSARIFDQLRRRTVPTCAAPLRPPTDRSGIP